LDRFRHRQLGTSNGCRNHTVLPYANSVVRLRAGRSLTEKSALRFLAHQRCRVHRIPSRVRDDRDTPLLPGETGKLVEVICPTAKVKSCPSGCFVAAKKMADDVDADVCPTAQGRHHANRTTLPFLTRSGPDASARSRLGELLVQCRPRPGEDFHRGCP